MRKFNKREQTIIRNLVKYYKDDNLKTISLFLTERIVSDDLRIVIRDDGYYFIYGKEDKKKENLYTVVEIINLFRGLVDDHLIFLLPGNIQGMLFIGEKQQVNVLCKDSQKAVEFQNGDYIRQCDYLWYDKEDKLKYSFMPFSEKEFRVKDFIAAVPIISPELEALVKSNFRTTEEKTLFATRIAAAFSILAFLSAITLPFVTSTKLNEKQHKECVNSIQAVRNEILNSTDRITDAIDSSRFVALNNTCK